MSKHSSYAWRAKNYNTDQYLEARMSTAAWITRVATRSNPSLSMWVKTYRITYYNDTGGNWVSRGRYIINQTDSLSTIV